MKCLIIAFINNLFGEFLLTEKGEEHGSHTMHVHHQHASTTTYETPRLNHSFVWFIHVTSSNYWNFLGNCIDNFLYNFTFFFSWAFLDLVIRYTFVLVDVGSNCLFVMPLVNTEVPRVHLFHVIIHDGLWVWCK